MRTAIGKDSALRSTTCDSEIPAGKCRLKPGVESKSGRLKTGVERNRGRLKAGVESKCGKAKEHGRRHMWCSVLDS